MHKNYFEEVLWLAILCLFLSSCQDSTNYNPQNKAFDIEADYLAILTDFEYKIYKDSSAFYDITRYNLKSKKPYRTDSAGTWFYRWTVCMNQYKNTAIANKEFELEKKELEQYQMDRAMLLKGNNGRILLTENCIYTVSAGCKEGWHVDDWFELLQQKLLENQKAQAQTILDTDCGGGWALK